MNFGPLDGPERWRYLRTGTSISFHGHIGETVLIDGKQVFVSNYHEPKHLLDSPTIHLSGLPASLTFPVSHGGTRLQHCQRDPLPVHSL